MIIFKNFEILKLVQINKPKQQFSIHLWLEQRAQINESESTNVDNSFVLNICYFGHGIYSSDTP